MRTTTPLILLPLLVVLFALPLASAATCTAANTPLIDLSPATQRIPVGTSLSGVFSVRNGVAATTGFVPLTLEGNITLNTSRFSFTPTGIEDTTRILFYAVSQDGCVATRLALYDILTPPEIVASPPDTHLTVTEEEKTAFSATTDATSTRWLLDGKPVTVSGTSFLYVPGYNAAGTHTLVFAATSKEGIPANRTWHIIVTNANRPPVQIATILPATLPLGGSLLLNLNAYFVDPDKGPLTFSVDQDAQQGYVPSGNVSVTVSGDRVLILGTAPGTTSFHYLVTDSGNASLKSSVATFFISPKKVGEASYCGDGFCLSPENCSSCAWDCGSCAAQTCTQEWNCSQWNACDSSGYQYRNCTPLNDCENATEQPPEAQTCDYAPTCFDGLSNGNELGVDCGGPCAACPSCDDGVRNQGESAVDCGGPCVVCPSCDDGARNQGESDVDCGGPCDSCSAGKRCTRPGDCTSLSCPRGSCVAATCNDSVRNQGESGVDCGGPCVACPSCVDGARNQGESGVDCGGPCAACPSCDDGVRNQDEKLTDCGGQCRACTIVDYSPIILHWLLITILTLLSLTILYLLRALLLSRLLFLVRNRKGIHFFYEDTLTYALLRAGNHFARRFRFDRRREAVALVTQTSNQLLALRQLPEEKFRPALIAALRGLYSSLLSLPENFEYDLLLYTVKRSRLPFALKVIILRNTKMLSLIELTQLYSDPGFALVEVLRGLDELKNAF